jgi:prolyl oligopeptidase
MKKAIWILLITAVIACNNDNQDNTLTSASREIQVEYPDTYEDSTVVDNYFGLMVSDPYRWLEDDNSASTLRWVKLQKQLTENYMNLVPFRNDIRNRLAELWNYERYSVPRKYGGYYYLFKNDGLQNQDVLYRMPSLDGTMEAVLNPNQLSRDGKLSLGELSFSKDGSLLAYQLTQEGSDWKSIYIKDLDTGNTVGDTLHWVKFSDIAWYRDGFFYSRYPAPYKGEELTSKNEFHQVYYHKVGTTQAEDELVFADRLFPQRSFRATTTEDERFLVLRISESTSGNALYFRDLQTDELAFTPIVEGFEHDYELVGNTGNFIYLLTNNQAANGRLIRVNAQNPTRKFWKEIIPESEHLLQQVELVGDHLVAHYLKDAHSEFRVYNLEGEAEKLVNLPGYGTVMDYKGQGEEVYFKYTSFTSPETIYRLSLKDYATAVYKKPAIDFDSKAYEVKQVRYKSYDGTEVPMFIIHKKGLKLDGDHPALLYGYGGFNIPITPKFNRTRNMLFPVILENGGVCAVPNLRGGGEFGADWHKAGTLQNKQNVFDDFQAAAEYLIANGYTSADQLAIHGASNGGLLVGACMVQRPDLFKVAIPSVGVLDMLRYHKFTIGWAWATDYGTSEEKESFDYLYAYSPLHNISRKSYPATMITTADHDDRVVPAHSFKFGASLQARQQGPDPILIRIDTGAGHGAGKPTSMRIEEGADMLGFIYNVIGSQYQVTTE